MSINRHSSIYSFYTLETKKPEYLQLVDDKFNTRMEAKLREYRAQRRRKELLENTKEKLEKTKEKVFDFLTPKIFKMTKEKNEDEVLLMEEEIPPPPSPPVKTTLIQPEDPMDVASEVSELESFAEESKESWKYFIVKWTLYAVIWSSLFAYFITMQFGAVFFAISVLLGIYFNTRTRPKKKGEVSAYSVFNENCQSIDGTLKAEELERQMLYGVAGIRAF